MRNDDYAGDVLRFGLGASYEFESSRVVVSPVAELVGWYVVDGWVLPVPGAPEEADNDTIVNLKLGARITSHMPGSFYLGYGFPLSDEEWYGGIIRLEYRIGLAGPKWRESRSAPARAPDERAVADRRAADRAAAARAAEADRAAAQIAAREAEAARERAAAEAREEAAAKAAMAGRVETEDPPLSVATQEEEVLAAVRRWSQAWSAQSVDLYLASYSPRFSPANGMTRSAWQAQRRQRLSAPSFIEVTLHNISVAMEGPRQAAVEFTQRYESNTYSDTVRKRLVVALEGTTWKILREEVLD